jgi:hypothetical protein
MSRFDLLIVCLPKRPDSAVFVPYRIAQSEKLEKGMEQVYYIVLDFAQRFLQLGNFFSIENQEISEGKYYSYTL